jgi:hypothetical protein
MGRCRTSRLNHRKKNFLSESSPRLLIRYFVCGSSAVSSPLMQLFPGLHRFWHLSRERWVNEVQIRLQLLLAPPRWSIRSRRTSMIDATIMQVRLDFCYWDLSVHFHRSVLDRPVRLDNIASRRLVLYLLCGFFAPVLPQTGLAHVGSPAESSFGTAWWAETPALKARCFTDDATSHDLLPAIDLGQMQHQEKDNTFRFLRISDPIASIQMSRWRPPIPPVSTANRQPFRKSQFMRNRSNPSDTRTEQT